MTAKDQFESKTKKKLNFSLFFLVQEQLKKLFLQPETLNSLAFVKTTSHAVMSYGITFQEL